ncbi:pyrimidodiazepine synthase-like isoform X1 [Pectinophora gossypiella]|uniref:pyrimidodiazepine synthase-like isoform X1 n=1 Tax=Pectinophora gossypiella TaxID=13191 RepID=UPI00214F3326|nr:pyrimidodiazepine synthase-like isoform X1 [Pectinophora gossypiella]
MIVSTFSFAMHVLVSSFRVLAPVAHVLEAMLPLRHMSVKAVKGAINYNTKHLKKGDPLPPYTGKLRVYCMRYCPFAQRTILALNAKQLDYEVVNIDLMDKPEWFTTKSPLGKVPAIEIEENKTIYESLVTVEYLDDVYPQRPLLPKDPVKKAYDKIIVEVATGLSTLFYKVIRNPETVTENTMTAYRNAVSFIQEQLKSRGTKFLDGGEPGYADYMIWPWFERIWMLQDVDERLKIDGPENKLLVEYIQNMLKDPAVAAFLVPKDILLQVMEGYRPGNRPNYDLLLEK